jgi:hypothetical protein
LPTSNGENSYVLDIGAIIRASTIEVKRIGEMRRILAGMQVWIRDDSGATRPEHGIDEGVPPFSRTIADFEGAETIQSDHSDRHPCSTLGQVLAFL